MPGVTRNGVFYPSVTEILKAVGLVKDYGPGSDRARLRGTYLHQAIQWYHDGTLDPDSLDPLIRPSFEGYLEWEATSGFKLRHSEVEIVNEVLGFCGHIDLVGDFPGDPVVILDIKSSEKPDLKTAELQLAAYGWLWDQWRDANDFYHQGRKVLQIAPSSGKVTLHDAPSGHALNVFKAALIVAKELRA